MPRTACAIRCSFSTSANRTYPSPSGPKPLPGLTATCASRSSRSAKSCAGSSRGIARPDEHRRPRARNVPADPREPVTESVASPAVDLGHLGRPLACVAQRDRRGDLQRLEAAVIEVRLETRERTDHVGAAEQERHAPAGEREALRERVVLDGDLARALALEDRRRPVAVVREVGIREVVHEHDLALPREVDEALQVVEARARRRRVVRKRAEQHTRPRLGSEPRLLDAGREVDARPHRHARDRRTGEARREEMNRIARARHERDVARPEQHPEQMHEPLLRAEGHRRLRLRIELDAVPVTVEVADRLTQLRQAATRRVAVVARKERGLAQLLDGDLGRRHVGIAEAEVDHILARTPQLELQPLDLGERIRRQGVDPAEVRHAADRRKAPSASRTATTSPITTSAGVGAWAAAAPIAPSGATITCSSSVVPRETTAAGPRRPASRRRARRRRDPTPGSR